MNNIGIRVLQLGNLRNTLYFYFLRCHNQAKLLGVKEEKYRFNLRTRIKCLQKSRNESVPTSADPQIRRSHK